MKTKRIAVLSVLLVSAALFAPSVRAGEFADKIPDLVWLDIGGTIDELTTSAALTGANGVGASVDFEQIFDLPGSKTTFAIYGTARVSEKRRHVDFGYVNINRSGGSVLDQDITWGDYTIAGNATVDAKFNTEFIYGAYRYDFLNVEQVRISGSAGASYVNFQTGLSWNGEYWAPGSDPNVDPPTTGSGSKGTSFGIPVPLVGFNIDWAIAKGLVFRSYSRFFRMNISGIDGGMYEGGVHLNWYFIRNLGIGLGWDKTDIRLNEYQRGDSTVKANYTVSGIGLYATLAF
jgi:hypothetical protein